MHQKQPPPRTMDSVEDAGDDALEVVTGVTDIEVFRGIARYCEKAEPAIVAA